ncbi:CPBP family intramembrane glutamic endopeptidase [Halorubrum sp. SP9]|uniref:CPBP family intramembrane glutamic endopeptidase n=1 Tax=Halorubrum sp. SP9 TaxID=1537267 RepID=UPI0010F9D07A|nr:CPBP family intramembrane glutamic endopeptidase [Halorubrum sp. SP9]TKX69883.1 CPBP family intramembrane metalloprotease [Halorubrum sp. SP9]
MALSPTDALRRVLWGRERDRLRATWRILLGFVVVLGVLLGGGRLLGRVDVPSVLVNGPVALLVAAAVGAYALVTSLVPGERPVGGYGLALDRRWARDFLAAVVVGCVAQGVFTALLLATGTGRVVETLSAGVASGGGAPAVAVAVAATAVAFAAVGLWEELLFRGVFVLNASEGLAARGLSPGRAVWAAGAASVLAFGPAHAVVAAQGATPLFAAGQAIAAVVYFAVAYVLTGSLAFPVGIHFATNFWVASVAGQAGSGFPALVRLERDLGAGAVELLLVVLPTAVLLGLILAWVRVTRGAVSPDESLSASVRRRYGSAAGE